MVIEPAGFADRELTSRLYGGGTRTRIRQEMVLGGESGSETRTTVNGLPFALEDRTLRIGSRTYGPFEESDEVRITDEGVFVGETSHGALPDS